VFEDDGNYFLWSSQFEDIEESEEIRSTAKKIVLTIRNFGMKDSLHTEDLQVSHVHQIRDDGTEHVSVLAEASTINISAGPIRVTKTDEEGNKMVRQPADRIYELTKLAAEDEKVQELAGLLDNGDEWVNLYRIYEFIQANIEDDKNIVERGWWSSNQKELFKRTANSRDAIGNEARHGQDRTPAPDNPMSYSDAKALVDSLLQDWLDHRNNI
jgi:hypothetical protein